ncbi:MAG TPA: type VI secretion system contractile sheath small subunit [Gammaproteobacteria bacterium]|nr:type VI secretion system contractile sheath small subunit [Gammaproteobacteria bacterium]
MKQARVNITLDVETHGARRKKELPLKLFVLGNFSRHKNTKPVSQRERMNITQHNFDDVLASLSPTLTLPDTHTALTFKKLRDFHPEQLVSQVPVLRKLMSMRNLLKDLKSNLIDNTEFRKALEKLAKDKTSLLQLRNDIQDKSPLTGEE